MTYYELFQVLRAMPPIRLHDTVTVYDGRQDEYMPVRTTFVIEETDVLDRDHLVLVLTDES